MVLPLLILFVAVAVRLISLTYPFGDYDEGVYLATVRSVLHGFPLLSQTYISQGTLFIYISELFYRVSATIQSVRLFPVICSLVAIALVYILINRYYNRTAATFAALYLAFDGSFLTVSRTFQVDLPWTAFSVVSLYFLLRFHRTNRQIDVLLSAVFFGLSIFLKVNPLLVPVIITYFLLLIPSRGVRPLYNLLWYPLISLAVLFLVVPIPDLPAFYTNVISVRATHTGLHWLSWLTGTRRLLVSKEAPLIGLDMYATVCLIFSAWRSRCRFHKWLEQNLLAVLALIWLLITAIAFSLYTLLFPHHFVFFILPAVLLAATVIRLKPVWAGIALGLIFYAAFLGGNSLTRTLHPVESGYYRTLSATAAYLDIHTTAAQYVVADDQIVLYLANRDTPPNLVDTSYVTISSDLLTPSEFSRTLAQYRPAAVVPVSGRFASLAGFPPLILTTDYRPVKLTDGATIYIYTGHGKQ
ncbi:glycosyltransferase family 39 protein [Patescibacteria group bacterium]|nr:glycosyltransferase family 39 protein [Patescibacteria group bacterium]